MAQAESNPSVIPALPGNAPPAYQVHTVTEGLEYPWALAFLPDGSMLITERPGRLRLISPDGTLQKTPVAGLPNVLSEPHSQLLGLALAPDFAQSRHLYFSFICGSASAHSVCLAGANLVRDEADNSDLEALQVLFEAKPATSATRQYGGRIEVLPDATLLLTLGDHYEYREQAQGLGSHLGKLVRINPDGTVPADNPFVGHPNALPEIYSLGHRNPLGIVWDPVNQRLFLHDNGAQGGDELNLIEPGLNYGWPIVSYGLEYSGDRTSPYTSLPAFRDPLLHWTPSIAPSGMTYYTGNLFPEWRGDLLVSALKGMGVHRVELTENGARDQEVLFSELKSRIRDVRQGPDGALYLLTDSHQAKLLRITPAEPPRASDVMSIHLF